MGEASGHGFKIIIGCEGGGVYIDNLFKVLCILDSNCNA